MSLVQLKALHLGFGERILLRDASLSISAGDRLALVGPNGSGKTTLMRIICGETEPDAGSVLAARNLRVGYLPQGGVTHAGRTLYQEAESAFTEGHDLAEEQVAVGNRLSELTPENESALESELIRLHAIQERIESSGYYEREERIHRVLRGLGFSEDQFQADCSVFSAGKQMRIALAGILLREPDILLLDEPTNYLDLETRDWLLEYLVSYRGGVLLVSHDRFFLDNWATEVVELFGSGLKRYRGNYSSYEQKRNAELEQLRAEYERQQEQIRKLETFISRFRYNASKAKLVQSRIKERERIVPIELPEAFRPIKLRFPSPPRSGTPVFELNAVSRSYPTSSGGVLPVLDKLDLEIERGEKLALVGPNGAGKSTLMRILAGRDNSFEGDIRYGKDVAIGFFSEDLLGEFADDESVFSIIESAAPMELQPAIRDLLGAFLFRGDDIQKPFGVLSGGERTRLLMLRMLLSPINVLVLDEPTNHLDLVSKDVLLHALREYSGTVVFVSHDRHFLDALAERVVALEARPDHAAGVRSYPGSYQYYLRRREAELSDAPESIPERSKSPVSDSTANGYRQHKAQKAELRKLEKAAAAFLERIEQLETHNQELNHRLAEPEVYTNGELLKDLQNTIRENERLIEQASEEWEAAESRVAELQVELGFEE